jgi:glucose-6-phosphate-specific signal transduction histidine kinase
LPAAGMQIEKQRKQFSSELHDDIGQKMVLLKIEIQPVEPWR